MIKNSQQKLASQNLGSLVSPCNCYLEDLQKSTIHKVEKRHPFSRFKAGVVLFFLLGFFTASFGQSYALNFDGINDFAELDINVPTRHLEPENFTLEFIIDHDISDEGVLISQMANQLFEIGITRELNVYTEINGNRYVFNEFIIEPSSCFHLSLVYLAEEMLFYVDGILVSPPLFQQV